MKYGEMSSKIPRYVMEQFKRSECQLYSVKGLSTGELHNIATNAQDIFDIMEPIMLEYSHIIMEKFFRNPSMTPGEIKDYYDKQNSFIMEAVSSELRFRNNKKNDK